MQLVRVLDPRVANGVSPNIRDTIIGLGLDRPSISTEVLDDRHITYWLGHYSVRQEAPVVTAVDVEPNFRNPNIYWGIIDKRDLVGLEKPERNLACIDAACSPIVCCELEVTMKGIEYVWGGNPKKPRRFLAL